jgi:hypothetical protein
MDYGFWNALGITLMAVFGLWAFYAGGKKPGRKKGGDKDPDA